MTPTALRIQRILKLYLPDREDAYLAAATRKLEAEARKLEAEAASIHRRDQILLPLLLITLLARLAGWG